MIKKLSRAVLLYAIYCVLHVTFDSTLSAAQIPLSQVKVVGSDPAVLNFPRKHDDRDISLNSFGIVPGTMSIRTSNTDHWPGIDGTMDRDSQAGTLWIFLKINGQWYATGAERLRKYQVNGDKPEADPNEGGLSTLVGQGWLYDENRWREMTGHNPQPGEHVGFMVAAGSTRSDNLTPVKERTNVIEVVWPGPNGAMPFNVVWNEAVAQEFSCPAFTQHAADVVDAMVPRFAGGRPGGTDDERRELTRSILEQLAFDEPGAGWTWKSADPGRPPSKDAMTMLVGGRLCAWDWQNGSSRARQVQVGQRAEDITGQNPIPVVAKNHLGTTQPPGGGGGSEVTKAEFDALKSQVASLQAQVAQGQADLAAASAELGQAKAMAADALAKAQSAADGVARIDAYLGSRPIPVKCRASAFGIGLSCSLEF